MAEIILSKISKSFNDKQILNNINLLVKEGEMIALLGPSGEGKTTILKIIAGLLQPDSGDILLNDKSILKVPVEKRGTVIVFQDYLLFPHLTVEQNIGFGLKMARSNSNYIKQRVSEMISLVELEGQEKKYPQELSGGQKQRVALARALAINPKVLLLDEPFSNLDGRLRESMREFICSIQKRLNITTILVTHDKEEALMTSHRVAIMLDGEIKQFDTPKTLYERPISIEVANFFGEANFLEGSIKSNIFSTEIGLFKVIHEDVNLKTAMIRPEKVEIVEIGAEEASIIGRILAKKYAGDRVYYSIQVKDKILKVTLSPKDNYEINQDVIVKIDPNSIVFI